MSTTRCKMIFLNGRPVPKLCECGGFERISNGKNVGSFFWDIKKSEFVCSTCGIVLNRYGE